MYFIFLQIISWFLMALVMRNNTPRRKLYNNSAYDFCYPVVVSKIISKNTIILFFDDYLPTFSVAKSTNTFLDAYSFCLKYKYLCI